MTEEQKKASGNHFGNMHGADGKDEWLTPPTLINALCECLGKGAFDIDPCSPIRRPWDTAMKHYTILDDGLRQTWEGTVFCNPPYGPKSEVWMKRMAEHNNGIGLTFARPDTIWFQDYVLAKASAIFFIRGRLKFYHVDGTSGDCAGAPSALIAYGEKMFDALRRIRWPGHFVPLKNSFAVVTEKKVPKQESLF